MSIEVVSVGEHAEEDVAMAPAAPVKPALVLDENGDIRKGAELPADFPANARALEDGSGFILDLAYPKTLNYTTADGKVTRSETFDFLTLRRLNGKRYKAIQAATGTEMFRPTVLAQLADLKLGQARSLEDAMDVADFTAVLRIFNFFITPGRRTGP